MIKINIRIIKWIYNNAPRSWSHKEYILYIQLFWFPGTLMFTFDELWVSLGTSIFGKSSSAANNARSRLSSRLSFRFSWLWKNSIHKNEKLSIWKVKLKSFNYWCLETKTCLLFQKNFVVQYVKSVLKFYQNHATFPDSCLLKQNSWFAPEMN